MKQSIRRIKDNSKDNGRERERTRQEKKKKKRNGRYNVINKTCQYAAAAICF